MTSVLFFRQLSRGWPLAVITFVSLASAKFDRGEQRRDESASSIARPAVPPRNEAGIDSRAPTDSLPRDPALRTGTLPNGMHYYVRANRTPAKRAYLYLAVNAGSNQEDDDQQGFAHFLEHMAFNGTTHFPRHDLIESLQRSGMRFGADINAYTSYDETVFMLEVPTDDRTGLANGLTMLGDWAGRGMLIDSAEVVAERGVVLGEWRSRMQDTLTQQTSDHRDSVLYGADSRYRHSPIGLTKLLKTAEPGPIRRFYHDWYRPDLMAVVAVGDFDPQQIEREIRARFGRIASESAPRPKVIPRLPSSAKPETDIYRGFVYPEITVLWKHPAPVIVTRAAYRDQLIERFLFEGVQRRLQQLSMIPHRPFAQAVVGATPLQVRGVQTYTARVVAWPTDSLESGLAAVLTELERAAQHGIPAPALAREKAELLRQLEGAVANREVLPSESYLGTYVSHYLQGGGLLASASQELTLAEEILPTITAKDVERAAEFWRSGSDRLTMVNFPKYAHERVPTSASLTAVFDSVAQLRLAPDSAASQLDGPLMAKGPTPGRITREQHDAASGVTTWTLSNGARVIYKSTPFDPDELLIRAIGSGGWSLLPDTLFYSPGRLVDKIMTEAAGLGTHDRGSLEDALSTTGLREFSVSITPTQQDIALGGSPKDIETMFQMLYLQFTAPKLDTAALTGWKNVGMNGLGFSFDDQLAQILARGNPRLIPPSPVLVTIVDTASAMAVYRNRFGNAGNFTFFIVGAVKAAQVRPLVERYIASLPSTGKKEQATDLGIRPWSRMMRRTMRVFDVPKASTLLLFDGNFPTSPVAYLTEQRRLDALAWTLRLEFTDLLREQMGGTYGVNVLSQTYALPQEHYRFGINFDAAPERMDGMLDTMFVVLDSVRARGATTGELQKIEAMQKRAWQTALTDNHYWLNSLELYERLGIPFGQIVAPPHERLTPNDIREAARRYLPANAFIHLTAMPQDSTLYVHMDSTVDAPPDSAAHPSHVAPRPATLSSRTLQRRH